MKSLTACLALAALVAACGDAREPVKVIAAPRATTQTALSDATTQVPPIPPAVPPPPPSAPSRPASSVVRAAPVPQEMVAQRVWQPGQPNGNSAFRAAMDAKFARAQQGGTQAAPAQ